PRVKQQLVAILGHLSLLLLDRGRRSEALQNFAQARRVQKVLVDTSPGSSSHREVLVTLLLDQANALVADGKAAEAERTLGEARELAERLRVEDPPAPR